MKITLEGIKKLLMGGLPKRPVETTLLLDKKTDEDYYHFGKLGDEVDIDGKKYKVIGPTFFEPTFMGNGARARCYTCEAQDLESGRTVRLGYTRLSINQ